MIRGVVGHGSGRALPRGDRPARYASGRERGLPAPAGPRSRPTCLARSCLARSRVARSCVARSRVTRSKGSGGGRAILSARRAALPSTPRARPRRTDPLCASIESPPGGCSVSTRRGRRDCCCCSSRFRLRAGSARASAAGPRRAPRRRVWRCGGRRCRCWAARCASRSSAAVARRASRRCAIPSSTSAAGGCSRRCRCCSSPPS